MSSPGLSFGDTISAILQGLGNAQANPRGTLFGAIGGALGGVNDAESYRKLQALMSQPGSPSVGGPATNTSNVGPPPPLPMGMQASQAPFFAALSPQRGFPLLMQQAEGNENTAQNRGIDAETMARNAATSQTLGLYNAQNASAGVPMAAPGALLNGPLDSRARVAALMGGQQPSGGGADQTASQPGSLDFNKFYKDFTLPHEGDKAVTDSNGAVVKFGINQKDNPDLDVAKLTPDQAAQRAMTNYYQASGSDKLPAALAAVNFETAYIAGKDTAKMFLTQSGGDVSKYLDLRQAYFNNLAKNDPGTYGKYLKTWTTRNDDLRKYVGQLGGGSPSDGTSSPLGVGQPVANAATMSFLGYDNPLVQEQMKAPIPLSQQDQDQIRAQHPGAYGPHDILGLNPITKQVQVIQAGKETSHYIEAGTPESIQKYGGLSGNVNDATGAFTADNARLQGVSPKLADALENGLTGDALIKAIPNAMASRIKQIATGVVAPFSAYALANSPAAQQMQAAVTAYKPDFTGTEFAQRQGIMKSIANPKGIGGQIDSINRASQHLIDLRNLAVALKNGDNRTVSQLTNSISAWSGSAVPTNLTSIAAIAANEITNMSIGGGTGQSASADRERVLSTAPSISSSPAQIAGWFDQVVNPLARANINTLEQKLSSNNVSADELVKHLRPEAIKIWHGQGQGQSAPASAPSNGGWSIKKLP